MSLSGLSSESPGSPKYLRRHTRPVRSFNGSLAAPKALTVCAEVRRIFGPMKIMRLWGNAHQRLPQGPLWKSTLAMDIQQDKVWTIGKRCTGAAESGDHQVVERA
jgi:hypothetical protein